jgi:signal peptidase I
MNTTTADTKENLSRWQRFQQTVVWEYLQVIIVAFVLVFGFIRPFVVEAFKIPSGSMEDTLLVGDRILVCKFIYGIKVPGTDIELLNFHKPARGDVFVFIPPHERTKNFIKRIVAVAGDEIETRGDQLYVNGRAVDDSNYTKHFPFPTHDFPPFYTKGVRSGMLSMDKFLTFDGQEEFDDVFEDHKLSRNQFHMKFPMGKPFVVPKGYVFAMGDNRDQSQDSRTWGPVLVKDIKGQAFLVYWSHDSRSRTKPWQIWKIIGDIRFRRIGKLIRSEFDGRQE